jgi:hypothetical protein
MIVWTLFGHLMTPEQHQTTTYIQRSESRKCEVTATIRNGGPRISGFRVRVCCGALSVAPTLSQGFRVLVPTVVAASSSGHKVLVRGVGGGRIWWRTVVLYVVPVGYGVSVQVRA